MRTETHSRHPHALPRPGILAPDSAAEARIHEKEDDSPKGAVLFSDICRKNMYV